MKKIADMPLAATILVAAFHLSSCGQVPMFDCDNNLRSSVRSLDGKHVAGVLSVQCGATTADASWVLLADAGEKFDFERHKIAVFEGSDVNVMWVDSKLQVDYKDSEPFRMDPSAKGIAVTYREIP